MTVLSIVPPLNRFIGLIMKVHWVPWRNLTSTTLAFGEWGGVYLQYPGILPPMLVEKVVTQAVPGSRELRESGKGAWALRRFLQKTDIKDLRNVFYLTDRQPVPFNFWICTIHMMSVFCHQSSSKLYFTVRASDQSSHSLALCCPPSCTQ